MMKILWVSPVPPARTDVANYTARIAPYLRNLFEVTFVHPEGGIPDRRLGSVSISSLSPRQINGADLCFYQIGNNPEFHSEILETARRHPGVVILHDRAIHEFLLIHYRQLEGKTGVAQFDAYRDAMAGWYGTEGLEAALQLEQGRFQPTDLAERFPLFEEVLDRAMGVVCHNPWVIGDIQRRFPKLPAVHLPLPIAAPAILPPRPRREEGARIRLMMFGHMAANRRACEFLLAWSMSDHRDRFELHLAGEMFEHSRFDAVAAEHGLTDRIYHHGFVDEVALDELIRKADMALNLRNPTMGEASGSQLRIWANGCPAAVSDTGWYEMLPSSCVRKIRTRGEHSDLLVLLDDLANGKMDLNRMAQRGFQQIQEHDPERYVQSLAAWVEANRSAMSNAWAECAVIAAAAGAYAHSLPANLDVTLPPRLVN